MAIKDIKCGCKTAMCSCLRNAQRKTRLICCCVIILPDRVIQVAFKSAHLWLPCQAPGVIGSVLGVVGLVSVYCDWARRKV